MKDLPLRFSKEFGRPRTGKRTIFNFFMLIEVLCFLDRVSFCVGSSVYTMPGSYLLKRS